MPTDVICLEPFVNWFGELEDSAAGDVEVVVELLATRLRVFYAFDPQRQAVLLLGGDKTGDKQLANKAGKKKEPRPMTKSIKATPWRKVARSRNDPARRGAVARRVQEGLTAMTLAELRKQLGLTQAEAAELYEVTQGQTSQIEHRSDHLLSTLRRYVGAVGGKLEITAVVGDKRIVLTL